MTQSSSFIPEFIHLANMHNSTLLEETKPIMPESLAETPEATEQRRPRSLYSAYSYQEDSEEACSQQPFGDFMKVVDIGAPPVEPWPGAVLPGPTAMVNAYHPTNIWRQPRTMPAQGAKPYAYYPQESETSPYQENWREHDPEPGVGSAIATPYGTISLKLHDRVRVEMTIDHAIRIINFKNNIVLTLSSSGSAAALLHPNGRVYQYGSRVEILANDAHGNNKLAKMWYKGVSFTSEHCALVYLVDAAGTRTTTDVFSDMSLDFSVPVFYNESCHGPTCIQEAIAILQSSQYWMTDEGIEHWMINNVHISQTHDGLVRVARYSNKYQMRTSPANGTASLTTPFVHCTASLGQTSHLFVKRGERRMHYDGASFIVRNAGHSAGFDEKNQLKVY